MVIRFVPGTHAPSGGRAGAGLSRGLDAKDGDPRGPKGPPGWTPRPMGIPPPASRSGRGPTRPCPCDKLPSMEPWDTG